MRPFTKKSNRVKPCERWDWVFDLTLHAQELPRGDQKREVGAGAQERRKLWGRVDYLLQVVKQEQKLALTDVLGESILSAHHLRDGRHHERRVTHTRQPDPKDARLVRANEVRRSL